MKDARVEFRLSDDEFQIIKKKADVLNMTVSDYVRHVSVNAMVTISVGKTAEQILLENLKGIDLVKKHGGVDTSHELLESRRAFYYEEYRKSVIVTDKIKR